MIFPVTDNNVIITPLNITPSAMDAADTCKCTTEITSGTAQTDINGGNSYFMGYLVA